MRPSYLGDCLATWQKHFPDYRFIEWNESNTVMDHPFLKAAYENKKWAFVADFIRIQKLKEMGGIYLDTDMYFLKSLPDEFLSFNAFIGAESRSSLSAGIIGTMPHGHFINIVYDAYSQLEFENVYTIQITKIFNRCFPEIDWPFISDQRFDWGVVFAPAVFYPLPLKLKKFHWRQFVTPRTLAVHLWAGSWLETSDGRVTKSLRDRIKYVISRWYIPPSFKKYAREV